MALSNVGLYAHVREYPSPALSEASSDATPPTRDQRDTALQATSFFDGLREVVDTGVAAVALESEEPLMPLYEEHPRTEGTFWERLGWTVQIAGALRRAHRFSVAGIALRVLRVRAGLTQSALGYLIRADHSTVGAWETGANRIPQKRIPALASALHLTPDELMRKLAPGQGDPRD